MVPTLVIMHQDLQSIKQSEPDVADLSRCLAMVERSTVTLDEGSSTGSSISVDMMGSRNSSGASAYVSSSC